MLNLFSLYAFHYQNYVKDELTYYIFSSVIIKEVRDTHLVECE